MAKLSNINGKFAVEDTGAIRFSDQTGTTGQILKSNGNSAPTWVDPNTVGTGPWLPLAGGIVSGATTFQSSLTVGGTLTVNGSGGSVFNSTATTNHIIAAYRASNGNNVATFRTTDSGYIFRIHAQNAGTIYVQNDDGSNYIKIPDSGSNEVSGNTTFAGTVDAQGFRTTSGSTDYSLLSRNSANTAVYIQQAGTGNIVDFRYGSQAAGQGTSAMIIKDTGEVAIGANFTGYDGQILAVNSGTGDTVLYGQSSDANCFASFRDSSSTANIEYGAIGNAHVFRKDTTESMRIDSSGNVLINSGVYLSWGTNGASSIEGSTVSNKLQFRTNSADAMIIDSSQNVGIGTTSPDAKLEVESDVNSAFYSIFAKNLNSGSSAFVSKKWLNDDAAFGEIWRNSSARSGTGQSALSFNMYNSHDINFWSGASHTMALVGSNVGIGTDSPAAKLHVSGTSTQLILETPNTTNDIDFRFRENGTNKWNMRYQNSTNDLQFLNQTGTAFVQLELSANGNVGIGTDSPDFALDIEAISSGVQLQMGRTSTNVGSAWMGASGSGLAVGVGAYGVGNSTTDPNGFLIDASGNLSTKRRIQAKTDTGVGVAVTRNLFVTYGGASYDYTFDPVALFGANKSGGTLGLRVSGWPTRLFDGIIVWRNDGGGSSLIGSGVVTLVQIATNDFSGVGVTVSLPSSSTNEIKISFTGWHANDHGWSCYIKNDF